jgi:hypothetical protein
MSEEEEDDPLGRNGNWHRLSISFDPRAMEQMGPNLEVSIAAVTSKERHSHTTRWAH